MSNILTDNTRTRRLAASVLAGVVLLGETGSAILPLGVGALLMAGLGAAVVMVRRRKSAHDDKDAALMPRHAA